MEKKNVILLGITISVALLTCCIGNRSASGSDVDTLYYPLDSIPADSSMIRVCSSEDGKMKFYCWDTGEGGTSPVYGVLCQIRTEEGGSRVIDMYDGPWIDDVHALTKDDGVTYYIARISHKSSSSCGFLSLWGYMIEGDTVRWVNAYDGSDDADNCTLELEYDIYDWYNRTKGEGWDWLMEYDASSKNLYIPELSGGLDGLLRFTDRYRVMHFDGMEFSEVGDQGNRRLHESLKDYESLVRYLRTTDYLIRIDKLKDGVLRLVLWKQPATMADEPEVVITGGVYDEETMTYTFQMDDAEYVVQDDDDKLVIK